MLHQQSKVRRTILCNSINSKVFTIGEEAYIVGGYLRDIMLGKESKDTDYIVRGDIKNFASSVYDSLGLDSDKGTLVELKKEKMIRIALKNGRALDFTQLTGDLMDNLRERDFTINAIAWSPEKGLIDPFNGIRDITDNRIKAVSIDNLRNDPLRLLRAYRFAAELGWDVDIKTRRMVRSLKKAIKKSAPERITLEFFKLLNAKNSQDALKMALSDRLLESFLSISHKRLSDNINALPMLESRLKKIPLKFKRHIEKPFSQELTIHGLLRLEHVIKDSRLNENRLRFSRNIQERIETVHALLRTRGNNLFLDNALFDTFLKAKDAVFDLIILSGNIKLLHQAERFQKIWEQSFLSSEEIMSIAKVKEGVVLGNLIYRLKKLQFEKRLKTRKDAIRWLEYQKQPLL